jgi:hypothetical protein
MNREIVNPGGAGIYPITGDVQSTAGNQLVVVTGLQGIPLESTFPLSGQVLEYNGNTNNWEPVLQAGVQVNGMNSSGDYIISVNVPTPITVNGV